jgi:hypothetical protein
MSNETLVDSLEKFRANLRQFVESSDLGENPTVIEIKRYLVSRIAELEYLLQRVAELEEACPTTEP